MVADGPAGGRTDEAQQKGETEARQTTVMMSPATRAKLKALKKRYKTFGEAVAVAVDRLYRSEFGDEGNE